MKKRKHKINIKKFIKILWYILLAVLFVYVMYSRMQEVTSIDWFFTTWR